MDKMKTKTTTTHSLLITAIIGESNGNALGMEILRTNVTKEDMANGIDQMLFAYIPVKWEYDDGEDSPETEYCQYAAYTEEGNYNNYLLATIEGSHKRYEVYDMNHEVMGTYEYAVEALSCAETLEAKFVYDTVGRCIIWGSDN